MNIKKNVPLYHSNESQSVFIVDIKLAIDKQILNFSEKEMDDLLVRIHNFAEDTIDEFTIIARLLVHADAQRTYYYNKQHQSYNYDALKYVIRWLCVLAVLGLLLYFIFVWYELPKNNELADLIKKLETFGITVTRCSKHSYHSTSYYLDVSVSKDLNEYQYIIAKNLFKQACKVHGDIYGWIQWSLIITSVFICLAIRESFDYIRNFLRPRYKQRFEAWDFIEKRLHETEESLAEEM